MITCISNNFGVLPANIQFKDYQSQDIIVLQGMFSVDTTDEDYLAAGVLRITMPNFAFRNSHETNVFVLNRNDGAHDITLAKAGIEKGNQLCIMPVMEWNSLASYEIFFASAFIPANKVAQVQFGTHNEFYTSCQGGGMLTSGYLHYWDHTGFRELYLTGTGLQWNEQDTITCSLANCFDVAADFVPLIYTNDLSRTMGSQFFPCTYHEGNLVISRDGIEDDSGTNLKFIKMFLVK